MQKIDCKPRGFWVSCETGIKNDTSWEKWCKIEGYSPERLKYKHEIKLNEKAHLKTIKSPEEIQQFTNQYLENPLPTIPQLKFCTAINWTKVSEVYDGILIYPYQWSMRLNDECFWYYPWDCASGCIWDLDIITSIELINQEDTKHV